MPSSSPPTKRREASLDELREWSTAVQFSFIEALPIVTGWTALDAVFHGGTSLSMAWRSPRYSEDLDFLLNREIASDEDRLNRLFGRIQTRMRESLMLTHPGLELSIQNRTRAGNPLVHFRFTGSRESILQHAIVKAEFWPVDEAYLRRIDTAQVHPSRRGAIVTRSASELPVATLRAILADKLTALATRPYLKWRDLFDMNFLWAHREDSPAEMAQRFLHHVSAYQPIQGLSARDALAHWVQEFSQDPGRARAIAAAERDLRPWLPQTLWQALGPNGAAKLLDETCERLTLTIQAIDALDPEAPVPFVVGPKARG